MLPTIFNATKPFSTAIEDLFDSALGVSSRWLDQAGSNLVRDIPVDVEETDRAYLIHADLPGMAKEDIKVSVEDGYLKIKGEKKREVKKDDGKVKYFERRYGSFERCFQVDEALDQDSIEGTYKDGVLTLSIPKKEKVKPKNIEIK